jgi:cellobiose transport system substrate-binding protein
VAPAPGGAGNAGGFYLALPRAGRHQQAAFQLAEFLAGEQAGVKLFRTQGDFPANYAAATALDAVTSPYFSGADVGKIFGAVATRTPATILGPGSAAIGAALDGGLTRVAVRRGTTAGAWRAAVRAAVVAARAG